MPSLALKMNRCENDTKLVFAWGITGPLWHCGLQTLHLRANFVCVPSACCFKTTPNPQCLNVTVPPFLKGRKVSGTCHLSLKDLAINDKKWLMDVWMSSELRNRGSSREPKAGSRQRRNPEKCDESESERFCADWGGALFVHPLVFCLRVLFQSVPRLCHVWHPNPQWISEDPACWIARTKSQTFWILVLAFYHAYRTSLTKVTKSFKTNLRISCHASATADTRFTGGDEGLRGSHVMPS